MVTTVVGPTMRVQIIDTPPEANVTERPAAVQSPSGQENRVVLSQTPVVRDALELFGGRILEIRQRPVRRELTAQPLSAEEMVSEEENDDE
jgi:hypothetical protein